MRRRKVKITALQSVMHQHKNIYEQETAAQRRAKAGWFYDQRRKRLTATGPALAGPTTYRRSFGTTTLRWRPDR